MYLNFFPHQNNEKMWFIIYSYITILLFWPTWDHIKLYVAQELKKFDTPDLDFENIKLWMLLN